MNCIRLLILLVATSAMCVGCGGGGGGSDTSRGIRILHGAIDAAPVDVYSSTDQGTLVQRAPFGTVLPYASLGEGPQTLSLTRAKTPSVGIRNFDVDVQGTQRYSLLFFGDNANFGLSTRLLDDTQPEERGTGALLRVVNGMTGASEISVSVGTPNAPRGSGISIKIGYGGASSYTQIPAGVLRLTAQRSADSSIVSALNFEFEVGSAYTLFIAGEADYYTKGVVLAD